VHRDHRAIADVDQAHRALGGIGERVSDERVGPGAAAVGRKVRLEYRAGARGNAPGLDAGEGVARIPIRVHPVENRAHDVEVAGEARTGVHNKEPDAITDADLERCGLVLEGLAVENDVAGLAVQGARPVGLTGLRAVSPLHIELALH